MSAKFPTAKLTDIAELNPTLGKKLPAEELVSFVPMASLSAESASVETTQDRPYAEVAKGFTPFLDGDVLVAKITPCFENGKIAQARLQRSHGFGSTEFHVVRARPGIAESRYLHHYLRLEEVRANGQRRMTGSGGQRRVPASFLADLAVPLPPLEEQRRIAAILDQAATLRTQRRTALALLDSLTQSLFLDMFGDPVANPKGWSMSPLADASDEIQIGPFGSLLHQEDYVPDGIPLINPMHLKDGKIIPGLDQGITQQKFDELPIYQLKAGDLVMGRRGEMGRCAIVTAEHGPLMCGTGSLYIRPNATTATATYLFHVLTSVSMKAKLEEFSLGATMPNLNKGIVAGLGVSLPPLPLQQTFATHIASIEALKATHRRALAALDALFASLQQRAFAGAL